MKCVCRCCGKSFKAEPVDRPAHHRLMIGDSSDPATVEKAMGGGKADLCFTSPPYAQQRDYKASIEDWDALMRGVFANLPMSDAGQVLVNLGLIHAAGECQPYWQEWIEWMRSKGYRFFGWYVWDKLTPTFRCNDGRLWMAHEFVFHFNRQTVLCEEWMDCKHAGEDRGPYGQRAADGRVRALHTPGKISTHRPPDSVARVQRETNNADEGTRSHPARFPVAFAVYFLRSWPGLVFDPFLGSGTTLVAAEQLGRVAVGIELAAEYGAVILERLAQMGLEPRLDHAEDHL